VRYGHLEKVEVTLKALSPLFIGSGQSLTKKEYIFDRKDHRIYIPDLGRLTGYLSELLLISAFEKYLLHPAKNYLRLFLAEHNIFKKDYHNFVRYSLDAGEVEDGKRFRNILTFMKGPDERPFIPGSSLKGAIRTAVATRLLKDGAFERSISRIERGADNYTGARKYLSYEANTLERSLFCKLGISDPRDSDRVKWNNLVNDFMRGVQVSDSAPIDFENLTICGKYDRKPDGYLASLPIYRECLIPGTQASFVITLEIPVLAGLGIDVKYIEDALHGFADAYYEQFGKYFPVLPEDADISANKGADIILGGGAGYASKTIVYPLIRQRQRALKLVSKIMSRQFPRHEHEKDVGEYKVSPHMLKTTMYKGRYYHMGRCKVMFK
jgi:CRISPR-associated protein Csm5